MKRHWSIRYWAILGGVLGLLLAYLDNAGAFIAWQPLGKPPGGAIRFVAAATDDVVVETSDQMLYLCSTYPEKQCWIPFERSQLGLIPDIDGSPWSHGTPPPLSGVIATKEVYLPAGELVVYTIYAIRDDGSVFVWKQGRHGAAVILVYCFYTGFTATLGALMGFLMNTRRRAREKPTAIGNADNHPN